MWLFISSENGSSDCEESSSISTSSQGNTSTVRAINQTQVFASEASIDYKLLWVCLFRICSPVPLIDEPQLLKGSFLKKCANMTDGSGFLSVCNITDYLCLKSCFQTYTFGAVFSRTVLKQFVN